MNIKPHPNCDPLKYNAEMLSRLIAKTERRGECLVWTGPTQKFVSPERTYGAFTVGRLRVLPHRWMEIFVRGPMSRAWLTKQSCGNTLCVNPEHLLRVTCIESGFASKKRTIPGMAGTEHIRYGAAYARTEYGRKKMSASHSRSRERYPERFKARSISASAIRGGKIQPQPCEKCGNPKTHGHHDDYSKPLELRWLCPLCHRREHTQHITHCPQGHEYTAENTYIAPSSGCRSCKTCKRERCRIRAAKKRESLGVTSRPTDASVIKAYLTR